MFWPSGPDHVLALTGKILGKPHRKWVKFVQIQILHMAKKVKVKGTINSKKLRDCFKWVAPPGHGCPSPPRPRAPPCRDFSPPRNVSTILVRISQFLTRLKVVGYEGSVAFSVSLQLRTLQKQGLIVFHSLISGGSVKTSSSNWVYLKITARLVFVK